MRSRVKAWWYEAPAILVLAAGFIASIYIKATGAYSLNGGWWVAVIFLVILVLFFIGKYYDNKQDMPFS